MVKNSIIKIDALPFKNYVVKHYFGVTEDEEVEKFQLENAEWGTDDKVEKKKSNDKQSKFIKRRKNFKMEPRFMEELMKGNLLACISSRPGQSGRADGYLLEGKELEFYIKKIEKKWVN